ncbi:MAG: TIGR01777 family oxidoreductase, partial [Planctomycetota bacterium]
MRILMTGASGLVGGALRKAFRERGDEVVRMVRTPGWGAETRSDKPAPDQIPWDPGAGAIDASRLEGFDAVINLAGANIAEGRWTETRKKLFRESRVFGTMNLAQALAGLDDPPGVLISASAVGFYGDRGDEVLTEDSPPGDNFLAELAIEWEDANRAASEAGIRTVFARLGLVLSTEGGALAKMLTPFRLGLGGRVGTGQQYWPCITLHDVVRAIIFLIERDDVSGPV